MSTQKCLYRRERLFPRRVATSPPGLKLSARPGAARYKPGSGTTQTQTQICLRSGCDPITARGIPICWRVELSGISHQCITAGKKTKPQILQGISLFSCSLSWLYEPRLYFYCSWLPGFAVFWRRVWFCFGLELVGKWLHLS